MEEIRQGMEIADFCRELCTVVGATTLLSAEAYAAYGITRNFIDKRRSPVWGAYKGLCKKLKEKDLSEESRHELEQRRVAADEILFNLYG